MPSETHLQMIQATITRLSSQSMTVKGWCITVTGALLGFGVSAATPLIVFVAIYVIAAFATLDAYYLTLERGYRNLYRRTVNGHTTQWTLDLDPTRPREVLSAVRSPSIAVLYGTSLIVAGSVGGYLKLS